MPAPLKERVIAAVGYLWVLFLVPLLLGRRSSFARFHAKQGLALFVAWIALWAVGMLFPFLGQIVLFFGPLVLAGLSIAGLLQALRGKRWELPALGRYAKALRI